MPYFYITAIPLLTLQRALSMFDAKKTVRPI